MIKIVSGLERSGTSLLMQVLEAGGIPIAFDNSRNEDINNPKGYFELEGGKIINKLEDNEFDFSKYEDKFIKITAFGLQFLENKKCFIIFSERNIEEILDSMEKMSKKEFDRNETKELLLKLLYKTKLTIYKNPNWSVVFIDYNNLIKNPDEELKLIKNYFIDFDVEKAKKVIDKKLYRNRRK